MKPMQRERLQQKELQQAAFLNFAMNALGKQAAVMSKHTGLSLEFCSEIVMYGAKKRLNG